MSIPDQETNWQEKGFGWIPDLPDITDPSLPTALNNEIQILTQEGTSHVEEVADNVIELLERSGLLEKKKVDEIRQKLLGETFFPSIKVYRTLRKGVPSPAKQILQLKQAFYLIYLSAQNDLKKELEKVSVFPNNEDVASNSVSFVQWLQEPSFDNQLEELVKTFQRKTELHEDGIVGLRTYTKLKLFISGERNKDIKVNLLCPSTLIPNEILEEVFDHLVILWTHGKFRSAIKDAFQDFCELPKLNQSQFIQSETIHATQIELEELSKTELVKIKRDNNLGLRQGERNNFIDILDFVKDRLIQKSRVFDELHGFGKLKSGIIEDDHESCFDASLSALIQGKLEEMLADEKAAFRKSFIVNPASKFIEQFESWFYVIEPLVSAFLQLLSPLANFDNFKQVVETGFMRLESCFQLHKLENRSKLTAYKTLLSSYSPTYLSDQIEAVNELKESVLELLWEALLKIDRKRKEAIKEGSRDILSFSFFDFLEDILACQYEISIRNHEYDSISYSREKSDLESLITAKKELFEIDNESFGKRRRVPKRRSSQNNKALFLEPIILQMPIHSRLLEKIPSDSKGHNTSYFFLPGNVDLSYWCPPIKDQGSLNACTAFAGIALLEYFAQRRYGRYINLSPRFLYKASRNLMNRVGDLGASVRQTMKALVLFGVPPEEAWPWQVEDFNEEPPAFCYAYAQSFQSLKYFRLDAANLGPQDGKMDSRELLLFQIKAVLAAGMPCMFGFTVYSSFYKEKNIRRGYVAYPSSRDQVVGGHAAVAVGYNDYKVVDRIDGEPAQQGAILIRNSWGTAWGDGGYGWLPYEYVLGGLTADWWSLLKSEWFDGGAFGLGAVDPGTPPDPTEIKKK